MQGQAGLPFGRDASLVVVFFASEKKKVQNARTGVRQWFGDHRARRYVLASELYVRFPVQSCPVLSIQPSSQSLLCYERDETQLGCTVLLLLGYARLLLLLLLLLLCCCCCEPTWKAKKKRA